MSSSGSMLFYGSTLFSGPIDLALCSMLLSDSFASWWGGAVAAMAFLVRGDGASLIVTLACWSHCYPGQAGD